MARCRFFSLVSLGFLALIHVGLASEAELGKARFATCMACHGMAGEGNAALQAPSLAGQEAYYLKAQLKKFKEDIRGADSRDITGMQMKAMTMTLPNDQAVTEVIAYIHTFPVPKHKATLDGDPAKGKTFFATCAACHGADAKGNIALKSPALVHLPDWYIVAQLIKFKDGIRGAHPKDAEGLMMAPMAKMLPDEKAMKDVAAYILSLQ
jgi:cytochrome c oxidase subunit II